MRTAETVETRIVALYKQTPEGHLLDCNEVCATMLGFASREELLAHGSIDYVNRSDFAAVTAALRDLGSLTNVEIAIRRRNGSVAWVLQNLRLSSVDEAEKVWVDGAMFDVTEQRVAVQRFEYQAYHDSITGLPNRMLFVDRADVALASARRRGLSVGILVVDVDGFAGVNSLYGRGVGDRLLRAIGERLRECVREDDSAARFDGDDFMIVLSQMESPADAAIAASRVLDAVAKPFNVAGQNIRVTASVGVSVSPTDSNELESLIRCAQIAAHAARDSGGNAFRFYESALNARAIERAAVVARLRQAIVNNELELHYQPEVNVQTGVITCIEALVRWRHPDIGVIPSADFLTAAEQGGLTNRISDWVMYEACRQLRTWHDQGLHDMRIAVNLLPNQLGERSVPRVLLAAANEAGVKPECIEVEIPEIGLQHHNAREIVGALKEIGALLAIDDFGSGGASFADLKSLPIDTLKIAPSFVRNMLHHDDDAAIVQAMITMSKGLDFRVVAEGVESKEQLSYLLNRRCTDMQGFFVAKPMPALALDEILKMQHH